MTMANCYSPIGTMPSAARAGGYMRSVIERDPTVPREPPKAGPMPTPPTGPTQPSEPGAPPEGGGGDPTDGASRPIRPPAEQPTMPDVGAGNPNEEELPFWGARDTARGERRGGRAEPPFAGFLAAGNANLRPGPWASARKGGEGWGRDQGPTRLPCHQLSAVRGQAGVARGGGESGGGRGILSRLRR
jgi:hypothetical protein